MYSNPRISAGTRPSLTWRRSITRFTGKELVARAIHERSKRRDKPFVPVNAAAISVTLVEATLFGYKKGAFTDAKQDRKGYLEAADTGTLFFDVSPRRINLFLTSGF